MAEKKNQVAKETATDNSARYRMRAQYKNEVVPALVKHFGYKNVNQVPRIEKIVQQLLASPLWQLHLLDSR